MNISECISKGFLKQASPDSQLSDKELKESEYDLAKANLAISDLDYKWSIIKCYYSIFHASKAVMFTLGYFEKKHVAVLAVLEDLNKKGKLESRFINYFKASQTAREDADYHYSYSKEVAEYELTTAAEFLSEMKRLVATLTGTDTLTFKIHGHPNIRSMHRNTIEFTKDTELTKEGDCIAGVRADFEIFKLKEFVKEFSDFKLVLEVGNLGFELSGKLNKEFDDGHEIVFRRSEFRSKRTFGIRCDRVAADVPREMIEKLKNPATIGFIKLTGEK
jgi:uncharacterized protein (UPF0332 family)